jgi:hypothetical protein
MLTAFDAMSFATNHEQPRSGLYSRIPAQTPKLLSSRASSVLAERRVLFDPVIGLLLGRRDLRT